MNAVPLIATIGVIGAGAAYYYNYIHCPDSNMERVDGECTCMEGYFTDPEDDTKCAPYSTTEAPENLAVLDAGVYTYSADGEAVDTSDESEDIVIDCLLCKAVEGSSRQAMDGRCLRCQPSATQQKWRKDDDTLDHDGWIEDYESVASSMATPPNPISEDYVWEFLREEDDEDTQEAETLPDYTPYSYTPNMTGFCVSDSKSVPGQGW